MCGLLFTNLDTNEHDFKEALKIMNYRGPESSKVKKYNNFYLGHNRLKIVDLKSDQQNLYPVKTHVTLNDKLTILCFSLYKLWRNP